MLVWSVVCLFVAFSTSASGAGLDWLSLTESEPVPASRRVLDVANDNGTCFCARQKLLVRSEASSDGAVVITQDQHECNLFFGHRETRDGALWYEVHFGAGPMRGWVLSEHVQKSSASRCADKMENLSFAKGMVSQDCLLCICKQESGCKPIGCKMDVGSLSCGYFQIKNNYWIDCGRPGRDWKSCADDSMCSSQCVQKYMARYAKHYGCPLTCQGFAREHNGGPKGCKNPKTLAYWEAVKRQPGCRNVQE